MVDLDRSPGIRPRPTIWRRLDATARHAFPITCTVLLMLLSDAPFGIADQTALLPAVTIGCVYFWSLFRPGAMPALAVLLIGLLLDLLGYLPIGVGATTLLLVHGFCLLWRRGLARQGFAIVWLAFWGFAAVAAGVIWALVSLLSVRLLPVAPVGFEAVLTGVLYPALAIPFTRAHNTIADPAQA